MYEVPKVKKNGTNNRMIMSKPHVHIQTIDKTFAKFLKKIEMTLYEELRPKIPTHCICDGKMTKFES